MNCECCIHADGLWGYNPISIAKSFAFSSVCLFASFITEYRDEKER